MFPALIVSDVHAHERPPRTRIEELQWLVRKLRIMLIKNKCKSLIFLGDLFDKNAPVSIQHLLLIGELLKIPQQVIMIVGNHDTPIKGSGYSLLDIFGLGGAQIISTPTVIEKCLFLPYYAELSTCPEPFKFAFMHKDILELNPFPDKDWAISLDQLPDAPLIFNGHLHKNGEVVSPDKAKKLIQVGAPYPTTWSDTYSDNRFVYLLQRNGEYERLELNITADEGAPDYSKFVRVRTREEKLKEESVQATAVLDTIRGEIISIDACVEMIEAPKAVKNIVRGVVAHVEDTEVEGIKL